MVKNLEECLMYDLASEIRKEIDNEILLLLTMEPIRFKWKELPSKPLVLYANLEYEHGAVTPTGLTEAMLDPVQEWCENSKCGVRISFDMFKFISNEEMTMFLLRWG